MADSQLPSLELPLVDIGPLREQASDRALGACIHEMHHALRDIGFLYIRNHGVPVELQTKLFTLARRFFAEPLDFKNSIEMAKAGLAWRGYFPMGGELTSGRPDRKEGIYFGRELTSDDPRVLARRPLHGPNLWPSGAAHAEFKAAVLEYMERLTELGHTLMRGVALALGLKADYFKERFTSEPTTLFRIFNYARHTWTDTEDEWGVREHTDYGFLTILLQDQSGGLEVLRRDGVWLKAPPLENTFVINIGDMLELWTRGIYRSTPHRVRNQGAGDRLSLPFFFDPSWETSLEPIDERLLSNDDRSAAERASPVRWDGQSLAKLPPGLTYGDYLTAKVAKVFPELAATPT